MFVLLSYASVSYADEAINPERPGFTNGAATVGKKVFQLEEGITRGDGITRFGDGGILRYGLTAQTELRLGVPSWQRGTGFSQPSYGLKTNFGSNVRGAPHQHAGRTGGGVSSHGRLDAPSGRGSGCTVVQRL